jgi:ABC-2 type transport system ATP-binding protein
MIYIQNLSKSYGSNLVLRELNIEFRKGMVHGIVGENGAGKTTLFRCIAGLEEYEGTIESSFTVLKNHLGFLMTEPFFFQKITGREYIQLLCNARGVATGDIDKRNVFDLPLDKYASTYSTGMKKKLALLGVLLQNSDCYILDEPFNGVDIHSNIIIADIIRKLRELDKCVIISSHIFSTLRETCDVIHLLQDGAVSKTAHREIFQNLEDEMREFSIGNKVEVLGLS